MLFRSTCTDYSFANKCCDSTNIVWVNTLGGYENYIFGGIRKVLELNEGDGDTFKTQDLTLKNSQLKNVYDTVVVNTGKVPLSHLGKLKSPVVNLTGFLYPATCIFNRTISLIERVGWLILQI